MHTLLRIKLVISVILLLVGCVLITYAQQQAINIIPIPKSITFEEGVHKLSKGTIYISIEKGSESEFNFFKQQMLDLFGIKVEATSSKRKASVILTVDPHKAIVPEAYELHITPSVINIIGHDNAGVFYGIQTLLQLFHDNQQTNSRQLSCLVIKDAPRFAWRAFMLDEARFFKGEEVVKQLLDEMAALKMNVFHWHLTDDQGWRVESKKYPLLTQIGSKRKDTQSGGWKSPTTYGEPHEGYYTQEQIKDILRYAKERHIKIVPEIGMPGHASAAIAAYPWLGSANDTIEVPVAFGKHYAVFNVTNPKVISFLKDVVDEMLMLFETDIIHIGGDEVRFTQWEENELISQYKKDKGFTSYMDIQIEFTNVMSKYIESKNSRMIGWNEILGNYQHQYDNIFFDDPSQKLASNVIVHFWVGDEDAIVESAKQGYQIINSFSRYTYLDYNYETISLQKAYSFNPIPQNLPVELEKNIIGIGCQMWGEWIPTVASMQEKIFPRIAAYAETGWSAKSNKNFEDFLVRLAPLIQKWKGRGIIVYENP